jgi:hypothetical protein
VGIALDGDILFIFKLGESGIVAIGFDVLCLTTSSKCAGLGAILGRDVKVDEAMAGEVVALIEPLDDSIVMCF